MSVKIISYTNVAVPTPPYNKAVKTGIVEDEEEERHVVKIEKQYYNLLEPGMEGEMEERETDYGTFNFFIPDVEVEEEEKVAVVTGASRGIGKAIALELARKDYNIVIADLEMTEECEENMGKIEDLGREAIFVETDVSDWDQAKDMIDETVEKLGRVDALVNNAGINIDKMITNMTPDQWQNVIDVDLTGVFNCTKAALPHMIDQGGGRIVNVSSMSALDGAVGQANYAAAKGGVISFTKTVAMEYAKHDILCNTIAPGFISTRMTDSLPPGEFRSRLSEVPLGRRGEPEEVARVVSFLVTEGDYITGQLVNINAGEYI